MTCSVDGTQAAIFTPFHCGALLMSQCTPLTGCGFCSLLLLFVFWFWVWSGPPFLFWFLFVFLLFACFSALSPVEQARHLLTSCHSLHVKLSPLCQLPFALISSTRKILYNDQAKAIVALEQKKLHGQFKQEERHTDTPGVKSLRGWRGWTPYYPLTSHSRAFTLGCCHFCNF